MSTTRYKIRLWEYDGEASVANAVMRIRHSGGGISGDIPESR